jgi:hypothetical protein
MCDNCSSVSISSSLSSATALSSIARSLNVRQHARTASRIACARLSSASSVVVAIVVPHKLLSTRPSAVFERLEHLQHQIADLDRQVRLNERGKVVIAQFRAAVANQVAAMAASPAISSFCKKPDDLRERGAILPEKLMATFEHA